MSPTPTLSLNFALEVEAADTERRLIAGKIVPFGDEVGYTNVGPVRFQAGSIDYSGKVKLLLEHRNTEPIGFAQNIEERPDGLYATFSVATTTRGNDALIEASTGLRDGFSVGVDAIASKPVDGVLTVSKARLREVSLVESAAFKSAAVERVAASEPDEAETSTEGEPEVTENVTPVEETTAAPAVEASAAPQVQAAAPIFTAVRHGIKTPGNLVEHTIRAQMGNEESALWVKAASDGTTTEWAGLIPTPQSTEIINGLGTLVRPAISAISTAALPPSGMTFELPRVKTMPTVAETAQQAAFSDTQAEVEYVPVTVKKYAGMQLADVEVIDRSTPAYFDELARLMQQAYAAATDDAVVAALVAGGTADTTAITLAWDGDELSGFISRAAKSIYESTLRFPTGIICTPTQWANFIAINDTSKRPIFDVAGSPSNPFGSLQPGSPVGSIMGLPVYVDPHMGSGAADGSVLVVTSDAYTWYESERLTLRADVVANGKVSIGYYGYGAVATKLAAGCFKFNNAA